MKWFLKLGSYLFHPLWIPLFGSLYYIFISPRYIAQTTIKAQLLAITIVTVIIPIIYFFMLKNMGLANSIFLRTAKERRLPHFFYLILLLLLMNVILDKIDVPELYYFFAGILMASFTNLILAMLNVKVSLHMVGISGITLFIIALSIHFNLNLLYSIAFLLFANGWTASSRLESQAHNYTELILGFFIGIVPQLILLKFWL